MLERNFLQISRKFNEFYMFYLSTFTIECDFIILYNKVY